jgi:hypothetical protein
MGTKDRYGTRPWSCHGREVANRNRVNFAVTIMDSNGMFSRPIRSAQPNILQITGSLQALLTPLYYY